MVDEESVQLLARYRAGDSVAADEIFARYVARLSALARSRLSAKLGRKLDAEDVVQSAFLSFFVRSRDGGFQCCRGGDLWRLLAAITVNKVLKKAEFHGAAKRRFTGEDSIRQGEHQAPVLEALASGPSPEEAAMLADELSFVTRDLDDDQRQMLELRLAGHQIEEIACQINRSERTVRRLLEKVRNRMQARFDIEVTS